MKLNPHVRPISYLCYRNLICLARGRFVTSIKGSSGLYFDKLLDLKFTNDKWNIVTFLDIGHIQIHLDKVEILFTKLETFCNSHSSSKIQQDCINAFVSLRNQHSTNLKKFSSISYLISNSKTSRVKRGLINAGGNLLKTFFGTLDSDDAVKFTSAINQVQAGEKTLAKLMKDNIHILKSTITNFNSTINKVNYNEKLLNNNFKILNETLGYLINSNDKIEIKAKLNLLLNEIESIVMSLSFDIDDINNIILFSKVNILHPTVLSPYQLFSELEQNKHFLPKHCELPLTLTINNVHDLIEISDILSFYYISKLVVVLKIPLVIPQIYDLYHTISIPAAYDVSKPDTFVLIAPSKQYLAITNDRMFYSLIESVEKCKVVSNQCYVCELTSVFSTIANPTCETVLITEVVNKLPSLCQVRLVQGHIDVFQKLTNNRWIFVQSEPGKGHFSCENEHNKYDEILFGTGVMFLPKGCKVFYKALQFRASQTIETNVTNFISNFNLTEDDCCDKERLNKTLLRLPFAKLSNINDFEQLLQASIHLDDFENELNKLDLEPSHLEKYSTHYLSLTYIVSILISLFMLYKARKFVCNKGTSDYCIQIFNQCHNKNSKEYRNKKTTISIKDTSPEISEDEINTNSSKSLPTPSRRNFV
ncbi:uncharacterized protein LOC113234653 [Hyposmocoma kahamanoa]|uniref:uncharacterized protein LOC113234653 n=1 Tax=Hyposmocoma kahamanoa TaxID=1477025 RepID=UPI000E6D6A1A|nr:uncharacterized protein LOC113234653 [Hyposmocoma kahamanoa]